MSNRERTILNLVFIIVLLFSCAIWYRTGLEAGKAQGMTEMGIKCVETINDTLERNTVQKF